MADGVPVSPTMDAAIYRRRGELEITSVDTPVADDTRALIRVEHCGVCGTDLHMVLDGWGVPDTIFGHEWSGRVVDPGGTGLAAGQLVVGLPAEICGICVRCVEGRPNLCLNRDAAGTSSESGAFATYKRADPATLIPVPDGIDARAAAYTEPLAVALHAVNLSGITADQTARVFGAGPIGAAIIAILGQRDVAVRAVEPGSRRAELAESLGAPVDSADDLSVPGHPGELAEQAVDVVFETSGVRAAAEIGLTQLTSGGLLMLVGTGLDYPVLDTNRIILNELRITGAFNYDEFGFRDALELIGRGTLPLDLLIEPADVNLDNLLPVMQQLRAGTLPGKVMVSP
jgi:(R,R)-butanediol dehydrogenase/meso-butanediol dehydrogenase/diacetyl reductase